MTQKYFIIILSASVLWTGCTPNAEKLPSGENKLSPSLIESPASASGNTDTSKVPVISFSETSHHFGEVIAGEKVSYTFKFKNTGSAPLLVTQVSASCGCTVPEYSKDPVKPGKEGYINVTYNSAGKSGMESKTVTVLANTTPASKTLTISAEVIQPEKIQ